MRARTEADKRRVRVHCPEGDVDHRPRDEEREPEQRQPDAAQLCEDRSRPPLRPLEKRERLGKAPCGAEEGGQGRCRDERGDADEHDRARARQVGPDHPDQNDEQAQQAEPEQPGGEPARAMYRELARAERHHGR